MSRALPMRSMSRAMSREGMMCASNADHLLFSFASVVSHLHASKTLFSISVHADRNALIECQVCRVVTTRCSADPACPAIAEADGRHVQAQCNAANIATSLRTPLASPKQSRKAEEPQVRQRVPRPIPYHHIFCFNYQWSFDMRFNSLWWRLISILHEVWPISLTARASLGQRSFFAETPTKL